MVLDELLGQLGQLGVALGQDRQVGQTPPQVLGGRLGRAARGEQPQRAAVGGVDEFGDLVELGLHQAVAAGRREVPGDVEDALAAVVEGRADVDAAPRQDPVALGDRPAADDPLRGLQAHRGGDRGEVSAEHQRRRGHHDRLVREQLVAHLPPHLQRGHAQPRRGALPALGEPQHVGLQVGGHPLGDGEDVLHRPLGLLTAGVALALPRLLLRERRHARTRGVADQLQRVAQLLGQHLEAARGRGGHRVAQRLTGVGEVVGGVARSLGRDVLARTAGRPLHVGGRELVGRRLGHPGDELVRLVDHDRVVLGDHRDALDGVDGQQRVVGDDQVRAVRLLACELGEALLPEGAALRAEAVAVADGDLAPLALGVARGVVALAGPAVLGVLLGPRAQLEDLLPHRSLGQLDERPLVVGHTLAHAVEAGVVGAALEHGVGGVDTVLALHRLHQPRDVALDELVLQRERRGRHHHALVVQQRGHEVGQRLAGAGAGLDEQVLVVGQRPTDLLGHLHLPLAGGAAEGGHGRLQHGADAGPRLTHAEHPSRGRGRCPPRRQASVDNLTATASPNAA